MRTVASLKTSAVILALLCTQRSPLVAQLLRVGAELQVNTYTYGRQSLADVAAGVDGDFTVTWESYGQDGDWAGVFARRFDADGASLGAEFQVNTATTLFQYRATIAALPAGGFVVAWTNSVVTTDVLAQRFDASGDPEGSEMQVNTSSGYHFAPAAAADPAGGFVIAWTGYDFYAAAILARRFDSDGGPLGNQFEVNVFTPGSQHGSSVAAGAGGFVVSWTSTGGDGSGDTVFARRFDAGGSAQGAAFQVNAHSPSNQGDSQIAVDGAGNFVVVWSSTGQDGSGSGIFAQLFDSGGASVGSEFQVNGSTSGDQARPSVAMSALGDFVIAWDSASVGIGSYEVFARAFHRTGEPDGDAVRVNTYTIGFQVFPQVTAASADGTFVVVWESAEQDGYLNGVFAQRFARAGTPVSGKKLLIRTPSDPSKNKLVFLSADPSLAVPAGVGEDPRCAPFGSGSVAAGATLRIAGAGGDFILSLPCVNWSADSSGDRYRYRDASGATCSKVLIRGGQLLKVVCKGAQIAYGLGAPQGDVSVTLTMGAPATNAKYCATFGPTTAATVVRDGSDGKVYKALGADPGTCP